MEFTKPALTFVQQAEQLMQRGMTGDKSQIIEKLQAVSYYRLSGYWFPYQNSNDTFLTGTSLDKVWNHYTFDRQLRLLILDAIERIEVSVRTHICNQHVLKYDAFAYLENNKLPGLSSEDYAECIGKVKGEVNRNKEKEQFLKKFFATYGDTHTMPPLWMAVEVMSFGRTVSLFRGCEPQIKKYVAKQYGISDQVLESWLLSLNTVRNICAHHGRLWNKTLGLRPSIPRAKKHPHWHSPVQLDNDKVFIALTILKYFLDKIAPQSSWDQRLHKLLDDYPRISKRKMGFPPNWQDCPIWEPATPGEELIP